MPSPPDSKDAFSHLTLYQRDDCHLCDLALDVLASARVPDFDSAFIEEDEALEQRYGMRVPVLRDGRSGMELDWPFDEAQLREFLWGSPVPGFRRRGFSRDGELARADDTRSRLKPLLQDPIAPA